MRDCHHTKFGSIWIKESKVTEGGGGGIRPPPKVENVLNRPGEIGLKRRVTTLKLRAIFNRSCFWALPFSAHV